MTDKTFSYNFVTLMKRFVTLTINDNVGIRY